MICSCMKGGGIDAVTAFPGWYYTFGRTARITLKEQLSAGMVVGPPDVAPQGVAVQTGRRVWKSWKLFIEQQINGKCCGFFQ